MKMKATMSLAVVAGMLMVTACSSASSDDAAGGETTPVTVALPVNNCLAFWPFYVAEDQGFTTDGGISLELQPLGGSAAGVQAVVAGQADVAVTVPQGYLSAVAEGADLVGFYGFYRKPQFSLATEASSDIKNLGDLEGKTVGISEAGGGDVLYMQTLLKAGADLDMDEDYQTLVVGAGSSAVTAVERGEVDAIALTFVDAILLPSLGLDLRELTSDDVPFTVGNLLTAESEWFDSNPDAVEALGSSLVRATEWGIDNRDEVLDICGALSPELVEDREFAGQIVDAVSALLQTSGGEQYGHIDPDTWASVRSTLIELSVVPEGSETADVDNSQVDHWNESR